VREFILSSYAEKAIRAKDPRFFRRPSCIAVAAGILRSGRPIYFGDAKLERLEGSIIVDLVSNVRAIEALEMVEKEL